MDPLPGHVHRVELVLIDPDRRVVRGRWPLSDIRGRVFAGPWRDRESSGGNFRRELDAEPDCESDAVVLEA